MPEARRSVSDIMRTAGEEKWEVLAARGAPTFLMLEDATEIRGARRTAEGAALAALAGRVYRGLTADERDGWPGGVALALQMVADRSFFPPIEGPGEPEDAPTFAALAEGRYVRVVNFHATPQRMARELRSQLTGLARAFEPVSFKGLAGLMRGEWPHDRPGVIVSFFDGFRDNFDVAAPILDEVGLVGWFFVVSGWISAPPEDQRRFAEKHLINFPYEADELPADDRVALSPREISSLAARGHVVASHTRTHTADVPDLGRRALVREASGSKSDLEAMSSVSVGALAWYAGMALGENPRADAALRRAGYEFLFANHAVQKIG